MFCRKIFAVRANICKSYLTGNILDRKYVNIRRYCGFTTFFNNTLWSHRNELDNIRSLLSKASNCLTVHRKCYSKRLIDDDATSQVIEQEKELQKLRALFPQPRVTLYEFSNKSPDKVFEIHYRQDVAAPKSGRKKSKIIHNDWTCTYTFVWPEKIKFEGTAISKRQAAEKAAMQALHYLYINKRIDDKGHPMYDRGKIDELRTSIQDHITISITEKSMERIDRIWNDYESGIKDIYEATIEAAQRKIAAPLPKLKKDSTIDAVDFTDNELNMENEGEDNSELKLNVHPVYGKVITAPSKDTLERRDTTLRQKFQKYDEELLPLPIDEFRDEITSALDNSRVVLLVGAAGCGKSTRAPAAILRRRGADCTAIVSEPRRVAAIGLAQRVADEMGEQVGDSIGYQVRLDSKPPRPPGGSILYCTSGVLLRRLHANPGLEGCTHVFIDEAHERDVNTDLTLLLLKRALDMNPRLKIMVMSATLDTEVFTRYFNRCPIIEVPGRSFPIAVSYLDDIQKSFNIRLSGTMESCQKDDGKPFINFQEVVQVIKSIDETQPEGAILVFLPGWPEIKQTKLLLDKELHHSTHLILPVHSRLSTTDQQKMFTRPLPGIRKIVLATNIAETSITIPDVVYVIDSGAHKENRIKENSGTSSLETVWVSLAGAKQRAGRAGRVQPGHCYRLYTREKEAEFLPHTTPEILRIPLDQTVLECKSYAPNDKVENFLSQLPEPPSHKAIQFAVNDLIDLGALTRSERLTRLGSLLTTLSLPPRSGRALLIATLSGAAPPAAALAALCGHTHVFNVDGDSKEEIRETLRKYSETSDHSALHWLQEDFEQRLDEDGWRDVDDWCQRRRLRRDRLNYIKSLSSLYLEQVLKCGVIEPTIEAEELNRFSGIDELTAALLLSGSNSLLRTKRHVKTKGKLKTVVELFTSTGDRAHIGSESVNYDIKKRSHNSLLCYIGGFHSTERRALVVHKTSLIPPHTALLFCQGDVKREIVNNGHEDTTILSMPRHKLRVHMDSSQANHMLKAREMLTNTYQYYIERDWRTVEYEENTRISRFKVRLLKAIGRILVEGHREYVLGKKVDDDFFER